MKTWVVGLISVLVGAALTLGVLLASGRLPDGVFGESQESADARVVQSIQRDEKVVLVSLGIQGLAEERIASTFFGKDVPGTGRTLFVQYNYEAMLGIDGSEVTIRQTGEDAYTISIPRFIFIGHDGVEFKTAVEKNGVLSWVTPQIDAAEVITEILNDDAKDQHIHDNIALLKEQAETFYGGIIAGVDPEIALTFEYADAS